MCGIVGVASNGPMSVQMKDFFQSLLYHDVVRGAHATGVAAIDTLDRSLVVEKRALPADHFLDVKDVQDNLFAPKHNFNIYIGHNRYATMGDKSKDENAHPFIHGDIVGVHNGSLRDQSKLDDNSKFVVDSDNLYYHLSRNGLDESLKVINGAFALVWYDRSDNTLNFIRNDERPMCIAKLTNGCYVWASESGMLRWLVGRHKTLKFDTEKREGVDVQLVFNLEKGRHLKIPFKDKTRQHEKPIVAEKTLPTFPTVTYSGNYRDSWGDYYTGRNNTRTEYQLKQDRLAQQWISPSADSDSHLELLFLGKKTVLSPTGVNQTVCLFEFVNSKGENLLFHSHSGSELSSVDTGSLVYAKIGSIGDPNAYTPSAVICPLTKLSMSVYSTSKFKPRNSSIFSYWTDKMLAAKEEAEKKREQAPSQEGKEDGKKDDKGNVTNLVTYVPFANMKWRNTLIRDLFEQNKYTCANCGNTITKARLSSIYILQHYDILEAVHNDYTCCSEKCFHSLDDFFKESDKKDNEALMKSLEKIQE